MMVDVGACMINRFQTAVFGQRPIQFYRGCESNEDTLPRWPIVRNDYASPKNHR